MNQSVENWYKFLPHVPTKVLMLRFFTERNIQMSDYGNSYDDRKVNLLVKEIVKRPPLEVFRHFHVYYYDEIIAPFIKSLQDGGASIEWLAALFNAAQLYASFYLQWIEVVDNPAAIVERLTSQTQLDSMASNELLKIINGERPNRDLIQALLKNPNLSQEKRGLLGKKITSKADGSNYPLEELPLRKVS